MIQNDQVKLINIASLVVQQTKKSEAERTISGVDQLFIEPELSSNCPHKPSDKGDVWCIGAILYLLVAGDSTEDANRDKLHFDFQESVWTKVSSELKEFLQHALYVECSVRHSVD